MRINPIIPNFIAPRKHERIQNNFCITRPTLSQDTFIPSFVGYKNLIYVPIKTQSDFRLHAVQQHLPCIYCGRPMTYTVGMYEQWKQEKLFSGPIAKFVETLKPYKKSFHTTERAIFEYIEELSKKSPQAKLENAIKVLSLEANKALLKEQKPIFKELINTSTQLPVEYQYKLFELIQKSRNRMLKKPYIEEFSGKELAYKIKNLAKTVPDKKISQRMKQLSELLTIPPIKEDTIPLDKKVVKKVITTIYPNTKKSHFSIGVNEQQTRNNLRNEIVQALKQIAESIKRKDITALCIDGERRLQGLPVICKFTNKAFLYDLNLLLTGLDNAKLRAKFFEIASRLPTSEGSVNAFITKHDCASSEKIAYDMLDPSIVTIEHMWAKANGGPDTIKNMAIACKRCNNSRQDKDMKLTLRLFSRKNPQRYWKRIINNAECGYFSREDVKGMLEIFEQQSGKQIKIARKHRKKY